MGHSICRLEKKVVLLTAKKKGVGQLNKERPFKYGKILRLDYEYPDSLDLIVLVDCSKGVRKMILSKDRLVKDSCGPESFKVPIKTSENTITCVRLWYRHYPLTI